MKQRLATGFRLGFASVDPTLLMATIRDQIIESRVDPFVGREIKTLQGWHVHGIARAVVDGTWMPQDVSSPNERRLDRRLLRCLTLNSTSDLTSLHKERPSETVGLWNGGRQTTEAALINSLVQTGAKRMLMQRFEVRNKITGACLGTVAVERPEDVLDQLANDTGGSVEDIARSLGDTAEAAMMALEILPLADEAQSRAQHSSRRSGLPARSLFRTEDETS